MLRLLRDLRLQEEVDFEVIVVDDGSPDDSVEAIRREFPEVRLAVNERNGGPCVSRNRGIRMATGDIVVGFDSDVSIRDRRLLHKVRERFAERPATTGLAFRVLEPDGSSDDVARWWHPVPVADFAERSFESDYFSGTGYAFRREPLLRAGLYPEIFYMHYEEVELAWRIMDHGGEIHYDPTLEVLHHANPVSRRNEILVFYKPRNQILLTLRCLSMSRGITYLVPRLAGGALRGVRLGAFSDWIRALRSAIQLSPACWKDRQPLSPETFARIARLKRQEIAVGSTGRDKLAGAGVANPSAQP